MLYVETTCPKCSSDLRFSYEECDETFELEKIYKGDFTLSRTRGGVGITCGCGCELWKNNNRQEGPFEIGTRVRLPSTGEYGVVVWNQEAVDGLRCWVAFYGTKKPKGSLQGKPYILNYADSSLEVLNSDWMLG